MARKRLLLPLKPFETYPVSQSIAPSRINNPQLLSYLDNRRNVHKNAINFCMDILTKKSVDWKPMCRKDLTRPICNVDLVVTIGGDGTLLQASHFIDESIPVLGVNSDPTQVKEVEEYSNEFDASRSAGYLCAATVDTFEQVLDNILEGQIVPSELSRISICINSQMQRTYALNDILMAHPCPAALSRFSFRITERDGKPYSPLANCRSSGIRVSTAAGSTAAMLSAGGSKMPILSKELQYMVREPISPGAASSLMHGFMKPDLSMNIAWFSERGKLYIDGCHVYYSIRHGDFVEISSKAPALKVFLNAHLNRSSL